MTNPDYTAIAFIVDRSGSMGQIAQEIDTTIASFIEDQAGQPGKCTVRLDQFDTTYENVYRSTPVADVPKFTLAPRGLTALLDAIGKTVVDFGAELAALPEAERPGKVQVIVATDGHENASREYTTEAVKALIEKQTNEFNWDFVFLAANQDAVLTGGTLGFQAGKSMTFDATSDSVIATASALRGYTQTYRRAAKGADVSFTEEQRKAARGTS